jgi:uncharacterized protein (TIGR02145 family)
MTIASLCWAHTNVAAANTFASRPDMPTQFYQWGRNTAWAATGSVSGWNSTGSTSTAWTSTPCPTGWRLPTNTELTNLIGAGSTWVGTGTRGAQVSGRFFGPNSGTCVLPSNMHNCVFLPALGFRSTDGSLDTRVEGFFWTSTWGSTAAYIWYFYSGGSYSTENFGNSFGCSLRCVQ